MELKVAICESGKQFFWCVRDALQYKPFALAYGYAKSRSEAEEKMWFHAGLQARLNATSAPNEESDARTARWIKKQVWHEKEFSGDTGEAVYTDWCSIDGSWSSESWTVVKKTAKRIFVKRGKTDQVCSLDRHKLESERHASSLEQWFYTEPYEVRNAAVIAEVERRQEEFVRKRQEVVRSATPEEIQMAIRVNVPELNLADRIEILRSARREQAE